MYTYATLVTALQAYQEDPSDDFLQALPTIIANAESRIFRDLDLETLELEGTSPSKGTDTAAKATGAFVVRDVYYNGTGLSRRSVSFIRQYNDSVTSGTPMFFAELSEDDILIGPIPAVFDGTVTMRYTPAPTPLSTSISTTWISTNLDDLLLAACRLECEIWAKNEESEAARAQEYLGTLASVRNETIQLRKRNHHPTVAEPRPQQPGPGG